MTEQEQDQDQEQEQKQKLELIERMESLEKKIDHILRQTDRVAAHVPFVEKLKRMIDVMEIVNKRTFFLDDCEDGLDDCDDSS